MKKPIYLKRSDGYLTDFFIRFLHLIQIKRANLGFFVKQNFVYVIKNLNIKIETRCYCNKLKHF